MLKVSFCLNYSAKRSIQKAWMVSFNLIFSTYSSFEDNWGFCTKKKATKSSVTTKHRNKIYVSILMSIFRLEQRKRKTASILTVFNQKLTSEHLLCTASSKNSERSLWQIFMQKLACFVSKRIKSWLARHHRDRPWFFVYRGFLGWGTRCTPRAGVIPRQKIFSGLKRKKFFLF